MKSQLASEEIDKLVPKVLEKYKDQIEGLGQAAHIEHIVPGRIIALLEWSDSIEHERRAREIIEEQDRDEFEALEQAAVDLVGLDRYERRAWSRQKRAIRSVMNLKLMRDTNERWSCAETLTRS
jgi:hypothetical protein